MVLRQRFHHIFSTALNKDMAYGVYLPASYNIEFDKRFPVLYFLHGRNGDENFLTTLGLPAIADKMIESGEILPIIIVCPRMGNSRGLNSSAECQCSNDIDMGRYEDYFIHEIIPDVDRNFRTIQSSESRFIGGASAGGFAACHYGLNYPQLFGKVGGHMPALELSLETEDIPYYGSEDHFHESNPLEFDGFTEKHRAQYWYLDAGDMDEGGFDKTSRQFAELLKVNGVPVEHNIFTGHHNAQYIKDNLSKYLRFYSTELN